jgi:hypothetical protein
MSLDATIAELVERTVRETLLDVLPQPTIQREALSVAECAQALGRSETWVRTAIQQHGLPARNVGTNGTTLIPLGALRIWLSAATDRRHLEAVS